MPLPPPLPERPRALLIDLAGVLHDGPHALPGAVAALARLRTSGLPLRFLTNTTRTPCASIVAMLQAVGFVITADEVQTAAQATLALIRSQGLHPHYLIHPDLDAEMGASAPAPDVLVLGDAGPRFSYDSLNTAFRLLMQGLPLIAMARNRYFKEPAGLSLDLGAFVAALEYASGTTAEIVGKPARPFFLGPLQALGVAPADAVLIGDDARDDIGGAQAAGIPAILVRTGKYRAGDEDSLETPPAAVCADFAAAVTRLLGPA